MLGEDGHRSRGKKMPHDPTSFPISLTSPLRWAKCLMDAELHFHSVAMEVCWCQVWTGFMTWAGIFRVA